MEKTFAEVLREKRKARKLSQKELGRLLGCTNLTVCNWERGKTFPRTRMFLKIREILGSIY